MNNKQKIMWEYVGLNSLRGRYLYVAIILTLMFIATARYGQSYLSDATNESSLNVGKRNEIILHTRLINNEIWNAEGELSNFIRLPNNQNRNQVISNIEIAIQHTEQLSYLDWPSNITRFSGIDALENELASLLVESKKLMDIRSDPNRLYPAIIIMQNEMNLANTRFKTAASLALNEIQSNSSNIGSGPPEHYYLIEETRYTWTLMISAFRLYSAGWFNANYDPKKMLATLSSDVELMHNNVTERLKELTLSLNKKAIDIQTRESFLQMAENAKIWYAGYQKIKAINYSDSWRSDIPILNNEIKPLLLSIREKLFGLGEQMDISSVGDTVSIKNTAYKISSAQTTVTIIVLIIAWCGYFYFEIIVIRPIERVSRALKRISNSEPNVRLPRFMANEIRNLVDSFTEMNHQIKRRQSALEHQAMHDSLTGMPNRILLLDRLEQAIYTARREKTSLALIMLDLDRFKEVNDTLGHHTGDIVLQKVSSYLASALRESDTIARLGGDEFAILLPDTDAAHARNVAHKIISSMEKQIIVDGHKLYMSGSMGITLFPLHGEDPNTLLKRADVAMYMAKRSNEQFSFYDVEHDPNSVSRLSLISDLHKAIERDELEIYFQPKLDVSANEVISAEVLLRWNHSERGFIPPDEIIALAEYTGIIKLLTNWVLTESIRQSSQWYEQGVQLQLSINLSVWNLQDPNLKNNIQKLLEKRKVRPDNICLEITESAMMADPKRAMNTLTELNQMGIHLSIDDFGTGFSSLAYLKKLPVDELKIDKSFVMGLLTDDNDGIIVRSIIDLAHNLGLKVVAEGVEDKETLDLLGILGCDIAQGYYLSKPVPVDEFSKWLIDFKKMKSTA